MKALTKAQGTTIAQMINAVDCHSLMADGFYADAQAWDVFSQDYAYNLAKSYRYRARYFGDILALSQIGIELPLCEVAAERQKAYQSRAAHWEQKAAALAN
jgi:hypothetical protein